MAVTVSWDDEGEKQILYFMFEGEWTWFECRQAFQNADDMALDIEHPISRIYDFTSNRLPQKTFHSYVQKLFGLRLHPFPKKIVVVERGHVVEMLRDVLARQAPQPLDELHFADSVPRARAIIAS
jgi:hypothetical protein